LVLLVADRPVLLTQAVAVVVGIIQVAALHKAAMAVLELLLSGINTV
jgi:hypothetical protein